MEKFRKIDEADVKEWEHSLHSSVKKAGGK